MKFKALVRLLCKGAWAKSEDIGWLLSVIPKTR